MCFSMTFKVTQHKVALEVIYIRDPFLPTFCQDCPGFMGLIAVWPSVSQELAQDVKCCGFLQVT
jgi:hypothetical protein